ALAWWLLTSRHNIRPTRSQSWIAAVAGLLTLMLFHHNTPSLVAGLAHLAGYIAVLAPLFWAPMLVNSPERLARLLWLLLICSGINSAVGVLQAYDPARWLPAEFSRFLTENADMGLGPVTYIGPHGE